MFYDMFSPIRTAALVDSIAQGTQKGSDVVPIQEWRL